MRLELEERTRVEKMEKLRKENVEKARREKDERARREREEEIRREKEDEIRRVGLMKANEEARLLVRTSDVKFCRLPIYRICSYTDQRYLHPFHFRELRRIEFAERQKTKRMKDKEC